MSGLTRVCVFCGSRDGANPAFIDLTEALAAEMVQRGVGLVYGGATVGLMGRVADGVMAGGGEVIGVIPGSLFKREVPHTAITELITVNDMHERKREMYERADGFIALPGGLGTLEEVFEAATWNYLGLHGRVKPVVLLDVDDYWAPINQFLDASVEADFIKPEARDYIRVAGSPGEALDLLEK